MLRKSFISILCRNTIIPFLVAWYRSIPRWRAQKWERGIESLSPRQQSSIIERINNRALDMRQHLKVVVVLDITALYECHAPVNNSEFCMECPKYRSVEIDDLEIDIGDLARCR